MRGAKGKGTKRPLDVSGGGDSALVSVDHRSDITASVFKAVLDALKDLQKKGFQPILAGDGRYSIPTIPKEDLPRGLAKALKPKWCKGNINVNAVGLTGQSLFFFAALLSQRGDHRLLDKIIKHWVSLDPQPDVNIAATGGPNPGMTVLWCATRLAQMGAGSLLDRIVKQWKSLSPRPNIFAAPLSGPHEGIRVLDQAVKLQLTYYAFHDKCKELRPKQDDLAVVLAESPSPDSASSPVFCGPFAGAALLAPGDFEYGDEVLAKLTPAPL